MLIGINYPWVDCGWDFSDPPFKWIGGQNLTTWRETKRKQIEEDFRKFAAQGISAVRWFLMADGTNYGMDENAPQPIGSHWEFDPLPAGHPFYQQLCDDFEFVLQVCRNNGMKLFPSLIDFSLCHPGTAVGGNPGIIKGGRRDLVCDPEKRQAFFKRVLNPLLEVSAQYHDFIYAWELINEPEWVVRRFSLFGKKDTNRKVSLKEMKEFIATGVRLINYNKLSDGRPAFQSSVGFAHWDTLHQWDSAGLGITLHQFHYYAQKNCELPPYWDLQLTPCIVGEFATAVDRPWPDLINMNKDQTIANKLRCIEEKGYPACFIWSDRAMDPATRWTAEEQQEVIAYLKLI
jgi:hypothetical protein